MKLTGNQTELIEREFYRLDELFIRQMEEATRHDDRMESSEAHRCERRAEKADAESAFGLWLLGVLGIEYTMNVGGGITIK
jgi:hypothetical protein